MRQNMMVTKTDLEATVKLHKESVQSQRAIETKVEVCNIVISDRMAFGQSRN